MAGKDAIPALLEIMNDPEALPRDRLNAAVSASRVEKLQLPGEAAPASIQFLRSLIDDSAIATNIRREAAAATAYFERRSRKNALQYNAVDLDERRREWRRVINSCLRHHLWQNNRWPRDKAALFAASDSFETPPYNAELGLAAILMPVVNRQQRRRQRALDEPAATVIRSESERHAILRDIAAVMQRRLAELEDRGGVANMSATLAHLPHT